MVILLPMWEATMNLMDGAIRHTGDHTVPISVPMRHCLTALIAESTVAWIGDMTAGTIGINSLS